MWCACVHVSMCVQRNVNLSKRCIPHLASRMSPSPTLPSISLATTVLASSFHYPNCLMLECSQAQYLDLFSFSKDTA